MTKQTKPTSADTAGPKAKPEPQPVGRPPHEFDARLAKRIKSWIAAGIRVEDIARLENISPPTMRRVYRRELDGGSVRANATVAMRIYAASETDSGRRLVAGSQGGLDRGDPAPARGHLPRR